MEGTRAFNDEFDLWRKYINPNLNYYSIDGDHFSVLDKSNASKIIEIIDWKEK